MALFYLINHVDIHKLCNLMIRKPINEKDYIKNYMHNWTIGKKNYSFYLFYKKSREQWMVNMQLPYSYIHQCVIESHWKLIWLTCLFMKLQLYVLISNLVIFTLFNFKYTKVPFKITITPSFVIKIIFLDKVSDTIFIVVQAN